MDTLPDEILSYILSFNTYISDIPTLKQVSKRFYSIITDTYTTIQIHDIIEIIKRYESSKEKITIFVDNLNLECYLAILAIIEYTQLTNSKTLIILKNNHILDLINCATKHNVKHKLNALWICSVLNTHSLWSLLYDKEYYDLYNTFIVTLTNFKRMFNDKSQFVNKIKWDRIITFEMDLIYILNATLLTKKIWLLFKNNIENNFKRDTNYIIHNYTKKLPQPLYYLPKTKEYLINIENSFDPLEMLRENNNSPKLLILELKNKLLHILKHIDSNAVIFCDHSFCSINDIMEILGTNNLLNVKVNVTTLQYNIKTIIFLGINSIYARNTRQQCINLIHHIYNKNPVIIIYTFNNQFKQLLKDNDNIQTLKQFQQLHH
jgi:hypothetical protein